MNAISEKLLAESAIVLRRTAADQIPSSQEMCLFRARNESLGEARNYLTPLTPFKPLFITQKGGLTAERTGEQANTFRPHISLGRQLHEALH
jgi:hypothetical protein